MKSNYRKVIFKLTNLALITFIFISLQITPTYAVTQITSAYQIPSTTNVNLNWTVDIPASDYFLTDDFEGAGKYYAGGKGSYYDAGHIMFPWYVGFDYDYRYWDDSTNTYKARPDSDPYTRAVTILPGQGFNNSQGVKFLPSTGGRGTAYGVFNDKNYYKNYYPNGVNYHSFSYKQMKKLKLDKPTLVEIKGKGIGTVNTESVIRYSGRTNKITMTARSTDGTSRGVEFAEYMTPEQFKYKAYNNGIIKLRLNGNKPLHPDNNYFEITTHKSDTFNHDWETLVASLVKTNPDNTFDVKVYDRSRYDNLYKSPDSDYGRTLFGIYPGQPRDPVIYDNIVPGMPLPGVDPVYGSKQSSSTFNDPNSFQIRQSMGGAIRQPDIPLERDEWRVINISNTSDTDLYLDDLKMGYAQKSTLYRNGVPISLPQDGYTVEHTDKDAPDKAPPIFNTFNFDSNNKLAYTATDKGTTYNYSVQSEDSNGKITPRSALYPVEVLSGIQGMMVEESNSPTPSINFMSIANGPTAIAQATHQPLPAVYTPTGKSQYLHAKVVDKAGNQSEPRTLRINMHPGFQPVLQVTPVPASNHNKLAWNNPYSTPTTNYTLFKYDYSTKQYQAIPTTPSALPATTLSYNDTLGQDNIAPTYQSIVGTDRAASQHMTVDGYNKYDIHWTIKFKEEGVTSRYQMQATDTPDSNLSNEVEVTLTSGLDKLYWKTIDTKTATNQDTDFQVANFPDPTDPSISISNNRDETKRYLAFYATDKAGNKSAIQHIYVHEKFVWDVTEYFQYHTPYSDNSLSYPFYGMPVMVKVSLPSNPTLLDSFEERHLIIAGGQYMFFGKYYPYNTVTERLYRWSSSQTYQKFDSSPDRSFIYSNDSDYWIKSKYGVSPHYEDGRTIFEYYKPRSSLTPNLQYDFTANVNHPPNTTGNLNLKLVATDNSGATIWQDEKTITTNDKTVKFGYKPVTNASSQLYNVHYIINNDPATRTPINIAVPTPPDKINFPVNYQASQLTQDLKIVLNYQDGLSYSGPVNFKLTQDSTTLKDFSLNLPANPEFQNLLATNRSQALAFPTTNRQVTYTLPKQVLYNNSNQLKLLSLTNNPLSNPSYQFTADPATITHAINPATNLYETTLNQNYKSKPLSADYIVNLQWQDGNLESSQRFMHLDSDLSPTTTPIAINNKLTQITIPNTPISNKNFISIQPQPRIYADISKQNYKQYPLQPFNPELKFYDSQVTISEPVLSYTPTASATQSIIIKNIPTLVSLTTNLTYQNGEDEKTPFPISLINTTNPSTPPLSKEVIPHTTTSIDWGKLPAINPDGTANQYQVVFPNPTLWFDTTTPYPIDWQSQPAKWQEDPAKQKLITNFQDSNQIDLAYKVPTQQYQSQITFVDGNSTSTQYKAHLYRSVQANTDLTLLETKPAPHSPETLTIDWGTLPTHTPSGLPYVYSLQLSQTSPAIYVHQTTITDLDAIIEHVARNIDIKVNINNQSPAPVPNQAINLEITSPLTSATASSDTPPTSLTYTNQPIISKSGELYPLAYRLTGESSRLYQLVPTTDPDFNFNIPTDTAPETRQVEFSISITSGQSGEILVKLEPEADFELDITKLQPALLDTTSNTTYPLEYKKVGYTLTSPLPSTTSPSTPPTPPSAEYVFNSDHTLPANLINSPNLQVIFLDKDPRVINQSQTETAAYIYHQTHYTPGKLITVVPQFQATDLNQQIQIKYFSDTDDSAPLQEGELTIKTPISSPHPTYPLTQDTLFDVPTKIAREFLNKRLPLAHAYTNKQPTEYITLALPATPTSPIPTYLNVRNKTITGTITYQGFTEQDKLPANSTIRINYQSTKPSTHNPALPTLYKKSLRTKLYTDDQPYPSITLHESSEDTHLTAKPKSYSFTDIPTGFDGYTLSHNLPTDQYTITYDQDEPTNITIYKYKVDGMLLIQLIDYKTNQSLPVPGIQFLVQDANNLSNSIILTTDQAGQAPVPLERFPLNTKILITQLNNPAGYSLQSRQLSYEIKNSYPQQRGYISFFQLPQALESEPERDKPDRPDRPDPSTPPPTPSTSTPTTPTNPNLPTELTPNVTESKNPIYNPKPNPNPPKQSNTSTPKTAIPKPTAKLFGDGKWKDMGNYYFRINPYSGEPEYRYKKLSGKLPPTKSQPPAQPKQPPIPTRPTLQNSSNIANQQDISNGYDTLTGMYGNNHSKLHPTPLTPQDTKDSKYSDDYIDKLFKYLISLYLNHPLTILTSGSLLGALLIFLLLRNKRHNKFDDRME